MHTIDLNAKALISLMARGARFLKVTPCICSQHSISIYLPHQCFSLARASRVIVVEIEGERTRGQKKRTLLWRWMVYSRATTSAMAERPCLPVFLVVDDISAEEKKRQNFVREWSRLRYWGEGGAHWRCEGWVWSGSFGSLKVVGSLDSEKADEKSVGCEKIGCPKPGLCK